MKTLILAAGKGTRMKSKYPKVLHNVLEKPMIMWVIDTATKFSGDIGVVLGYGIDDVKKIIPDTVKVFEQKEQLGTGHAVMSAEEFLNDGDNLIILYGDGPMITVETLKSLVAQHTRENNDATILTVRLDDPYGYGRVIRNSEDKFLKIVEHKDATEEEREVNEINTGIAVYKLDKLREGIKKINNNNSQGEYYLPDVFYHFDTVGIYVSDDPFEVSGANDRVQLAELEKEKRYRILRDLMLGGVTIIDPDSTYIGPEVKIGCDTVIEPQTFIFGDTIIGEDCRIGPMTRINNCKIGNGVTVLRSECEKAEIHDKVSVGPFARLREGTVLEEKVKIGNFVESKKSKIGKGSKAQHLTYLGDATIGENVNVGAGTITCNYDGVNKFKTFIGDNAFIGSNSSLVAPVNIGKNALVGAGSVITEDVPEESLALGRARQTVKPNWKKPNK